MFHHIAYNCYSVVYKGTVSIQVHRLTVPRFHFEELASMHAEAVAEEVDVVFAGVTSRTFALAKKASNVLGPVGGGLIANTIPAGQ